MDELEFGILGPLEVRRGGQLVPITAPRQRAVLTLLLLEANRVVPTDRLVDRLWKLPPPAARTTVQSLVLRLRRSLSGPPPGLAEEPGELITRHPGYLLRVGPGRLDLQCFDTLLRLGRAALAAGDARDAASRFRGGLALWRGPALVDAPTDGPPASCLPRLEESYLEAVEGRIQADLLLGRHAEVVGELRGLVGEQPLREGLHALLMVALFRSGRQAEALQTYRALRRVLAEELGIEPCAVVRDLHGEILAGDLAAGPVRVAGVGRR
jgi:DNA-binding SARP family transcriptional activator